MTIKFWDLDDGQANREMRNVGSVMELAVGNDGQTLAAISYDGVVRVWRGDSEEPALVIRADAARPAPSGWSVEISPDGRTLATAGNVGVVRLFDMATGDPVFPPEG